jgi:hypothetical protein
VASLQIATAQAGSTTNAFLLDKLEELFDNSGTNGGHLRGSINGPTPLNIKPKFVSVSAGTLTIVSGTGGLTQSAETMPCATIATGTLYVELQVLPTSIVQTLTVNTFLSSANTALKLRLPTLSTLCNDNFSSTINQSQVTTSIPIHSTTTNTYRVTIGTVKGSPTNVTVQLTVTLTP